MMARRQKIRPHPNMLEEAPAYVDPVGLLLKNSVAWINLARQKREEAKRSQNKTKKCTVCVADRTISGPYPR